MSARSPPSDSYSSVNPPKKRTVSLSSRETDPTPRDRKASAGVVTFVEWIMEPRLGDMPTARFLSGVVSGVGAALILGWLLFRNKGETGRRYA